MKKVLFLLTFVSQVVFSYNIDFTDSEGVTSGHCNDGAFFTASMMDNLYYVSSDNGSASARDIGTAIKKACKE